MAKVESSSLIQSLRNVPILYKLDEAKLQRLSEIGKELNFESGMTIIKEFEPDRTFYLILQGTVEVRKGNFVLSKLGAGQFFGEMAFVDDIPTERSANVVATEQLKCLAIQGWSWYNFLRSNPDVSIEVIRVLASRLREANEALAAK